jgi:hypothetical protein
MENEIIFKVQIIGENHISNYVLVYFSRSNISTSTSSTYKIIVVKKVTAIFVITTKQNLKTYFQKILLRSGKFLLRLFNQIIIEVLSSIIARILNQNR